MNNSSAIVNLHVAIIVSGCNYRFTISSYRVNTTIMEWGEHAAIEHFQSGVSGKRSVNTTLITLLTVWDYTKSNMHVNDIQLCDKKIIAYHIITFYYTHVYYFSD